MSKIINKSITVYEAMLKIQNGEYVMPAFQRQYVWSMEHIEKLWDSILLDYPIATFLFWKVDDNNITWDTYFCNFLTEVTFDSRKQADSVNYELSSIDTNLTNTAILDGQQRLTSLYLSLFGECTIKPKFARKSTNAKVYTKLLIELNKHKISVDEEEYNSKKYDIKFTDKVLKLSPTQFEIKSIISEKFRCKETRTKAIEDAISYVPADSKDYARGILNKLCNKVYEEELIGYTEIIGMGQDDALEMFVRFNSGGKALRKAEITMSILEAYWPSAKTEFGKVLVGSYANFDTDFIIRTALMLYGDVVKSNINKNTAEELKNNWGDFKRALRNLESLLQSIKMDVGRFANSWNVLLPIIYYIYNNPDFEQNVTSVKAYLVRAILFTYFQSGTTSKLQQMKNNIINFNMEITVDMLNQMNELRVSEGKIEDIINAEKGSRVATEALYFLSYEYLNKNFKYEQDHLHPAARFDGSKPLTITISQWNAWRGNRNRLPNLHLLEGRSNGSKNDMRLVDYYNDMNDEQRALFCKQSLIPSNVSLELNDFGDFYEERKKLLIAKLKELLVADS